MKTTLYWVSALLLGIFWPISFYLANSGSWLPFGAVVSIVVLDWFLFLKHFEYRYFLYLLAPLIHPALLLFPFLVLLLNFKDLKKRSLIIFSVLLLAATLFTGKTFFANSIFTPDPLANDTLVKKITLIPNRKFARIFENKTTIFQDKLKSNFFLSVDLNNYFFALHPQESVDNQNLTKYPTLALIPFLTGLYYIFEDKRKKWIINTFLAGVFAIAFINNLDRYDVVFMLPISLICFYGLKKIYLSKNLISGLFSLLYFPFTLFELLRVFTYR